jgi:hypothetical protein
MLESSPMINIHATASAAPGAGTPEYANADIWQ